MGSVQRSGGRLLGEEMKERAGQSHNAYHLAQCEQRLAWHRLPAPWRRRRACVLHVYVQCFYGVVLTRCWPTTAR